MSRLLPFALASFVLAAFPSFHATAEKRTVCTITDYCDGTLVSVQRHVVSVRDLVRHRTVTVTAGQVTRKDLTAP